MGRAAEHGCDERHETDCLLHANTNEELRRCLCRCVLVCGDFIWISVRVAEVQGHGVRVVLYGHDYLWERGKVAAPACECLRADAQCDGSPVLLVRPLEQSDVDSVIRILQRQRVHTAIRLMMVIRP